MQCFWTDSTFWIIIQIFTSIRLRIFALNSNIRDFHISKVGFTPCRKAFHEAYFTQLFEACRLMPPLAESRSMKLNCWVPARRESVLLWELINTHSVLRERPPTQRQVYDFTVQNNSWLPYHKESLNVHCCCCCRKSQNLWTFAAIESQGFY